MVEGASLEQPQPQSFVRLGYRAGRAAQRLWFPLLGHWLGAGFNLAGFGLLSPLVHAQQNKQQQRQNFVAIVRGFSVATRVVACVCLHHRDIGNVSDADLVRHCAAQLFIGIGVVHSRWTVVGTGRWGGRRFGRTRAHTPATDAGAKQVEGN